MRDRILAILALVRSIDIACLTDPRVFGTAASGVIDGLIAEGVVRRVGDALSLVRP